MLARACAVVLVSTLAAAVSGDDGGPDAPGAYPLSLRVGEAVAICRTGTILCPAGAPICDDTSIVTPEITEAGLVFKGANPGTTLCSAQASSGQGARRVYRITVTP